MCGRFGQHYTWREIWELYNLTARWNLQASWNIAPTQEADVVRDVDGARALTRMRFGLVPFWAKDEKIAYKMINARAETVAEKAAFRAALKERRCIVPASGFYEWTADEGDKQPHHITRADGQVISLAGIWERSTLPDGEELLSFAIVTTQAGPDVKVLHHRQPVILEADSLSAWLEEGAGNLLAPSPAGVLTHRSVSKAVNSPRNNGPELLGEAP